MTKREALLEEVRKLLHGRRFAYHQVFNKENFYTQEVLADLARFCRAHKPTFEVDPRAHALLEGRREVWLRIEKHLKLSPEEFWRLYGRQE